MHAWPSALPDAGPAPPSPCSPAGAWPGQHPSSGTGWQGGDHPQEEGCSCREKRAGSPCAYFKHLQDVSTENGRPRTMYIVCRRLYEKGVQIPVCLWATHRGLWKDREQPATGQDARERDGESGLPFLGQRAGDRSRAQPSRANVPPHRRALQLINRTQTHLGLPCRPLLPGQPP